MNPEGSSSPLTLIADDQPDVLEALRLLLKREGFRIEAASSPKAVLEHVQAREFDVLLIDLNYARDTTSGEEGLDLLARLQRLDSTLPVVVMTAWGSIPLAVEAMRRGASDFVQKPWDNQQLLATLRTQIRNRRQPQARHELEEARAVQRGMLPRELPQLPGFDISVAWRPLEAVSGDYVDVLELGPGGVAFAIADVIGKGVPAALLMSNVQAGVRSFAQESFRTADLSARVNRLISGNTGSGRFITFFYGVLDGEARILRYTNAGHCAPLLVRVDGQIERLTEGGAVLGVFPDYSYQECSVRLRPGDRLVLFTDGVTEVPDASGEEFGEERLASVVREYRESPAAVLQKKILSAAADFAGSDFKDDVTVVVVAVEPAAP